MLEKLLDNKVHERDLIKKEVEKITLKLEKLNRDKKMVEMELEEIEKTMNESKEKQNSII